MERNPAQERTGRRSDTHPPILRFDSTHLSEAHVSARKQSTLKFSELTVVISEATPPPAKNHKVKQFYAHKEPEEPKSAGVHPHSTSPQPTVEPVSALVYSHSAHISPANEPASPPLSTSHPGDQSSPGPNAQANWREGDVSEERRRTRDFGQWIRLGETGFLKPKNIRKTY